jgi:hypothetical protein
VKSIILFFLLFVAFLSCKENQEKQVTQTENESFKPFVFNLQNMWTDFEQRVSFPNWFNDSILQSQKIGAIHRSIYEKPTASKDDNYPDSIYLKEKISYYFYPNGHIKFLSITSFVEGEKIGTATFSYQNIKDKFGYNFANLSDSFSVNPQLLQSHFQVDSLIYRHADYLNFMEKSSGNHLFVVLNNKKLDALMIDSIMKPNFTDWMMLGNPRKPTKLYRLKNKVNQLQVRNFSYSVHNNQFLFSVREHFPFETRRKLIINQNTCNGFIDSTFSNGSFLQQTKYIFKGKAYFPEIVNITKSYHESKPAWETIEYYIYEKQLQVQP